MKVIVTGAAGFIGAAACRKLAGLGMEVVGIDCMNSYYDVELKRQRLAVLLGVKDGRDWELRKSQTLEGMRFAKGDLTDKAGLDALIASERPDTVLNLAAQAGVRYSIENPYAYLNSNVVGFLNVLEACRNYGVEYLVFSSSSSVYGLNRKVPFCEEDKVDTPVSLYAASKKSDELMAYAYSKLYGLTVTGLRYFTVYGPWGRPDMAPMLFAKAIYVGEPIKIFNKGDLLRDFTYVDDIVDGTAAVVARKPSNADANGVKYQIYNIGCGHPVKLMDFIAALEGAIGKEAVKTYLPMQNGDVYETFADTQKLNNEYGYEPSTQLVEGIRKFVGWYKGFYGC
jgi:UDP-glucuronate 4-epimerase